MGLTIYYTLSLREEISMDVVLELVRRTGRFARKIGCKEAGEPLRAEEHGIEAGMSFPISKPRTDGVRYYSQANATRGWFLMVWPGEGCETANFGLCQYPRRACASGRDRDILTGFKGGWRFQGACKTQYAGEHGWEHFLKCHRMVISLLDFWRGLGVRVKVSDEGDFWKTRSVGKLRNQFDRYNGLMAAMGGMFKDSGNSLTVESPIFDYKNFERLEHEGWQEFGERIERMREKLGREFY
jgi:hypothetical protein